MPFGIPEACSLDTAQRLCTPESPCRGLCAAMPVAKYIVETTAVLKIRSLTGAFTCHTISGLMVESF